MTIQPSLAIHSKIALVWAIAASMCLGPVSLVAKNPEALDLIVWTIAEVSLFIVLFPALAKRVPHIKMFFFTQALSEGQRRAIETRNMGRYKTEAKKNNYEEKYLSYAITYIVLACLAIAGDFLLQYAYSGPGLAALKSLPLAFSMYMVGILLMLLTSVLFCKQFTKAK